MFRTFDILLIVIMTVAATITYSIKHKAETVLDDVHKLDAEIKLEKDTIDLLKADWALATQPSRLARLADTFKDDLKLQLTDSTQIVQPQEMPMLKADVGLADAEAAGLAPDARKTDEVKPAQAKDAIARASGSTGDTVKASAPKSDVAKAAPAKPAANVKLDVAKTAPVKVAPVMKVDAVKLPPVKPAPQKADAAKAGAQKTDSVKTGSVKP